MSKYNDLSEMYANDSDFYSSYRVNASKLIAKVVLAIKEHIGIPDKQLYFTPLNEDHKSNTEYSVYGATHINQDTYCHTGLVIVIERAPNTLPKRSLKMILKHKIQNGFFLLNISGSEKEFKFHINNSEMNFSEICEYVYQVLVSEIDNSFKKFLDGDSSQNIKEYEKTVLN